MRLHTEVEHGIQDVNIMVATSTNVAPMEVVVKAKESYVPGDDPIASKLLIKTSENTRTTGHH